MRERQNLKTKLTGLKTTLYLKAALASGEPGQACACALCISNCKWRTCRTCNYSNMRTVSNGKDLIMLYWKLWKWHVVPVINENWAAFWQCCTVVPPW
jgi:hypothetical protein